VPGGEGKSVRGGKKGVGKPKNLNSEKGSIGLIGKAKGVVQKKDGQRKNRGIKMGGFVKKKPPKWTLKRGIFKGGKR